MFFTSINLFKVSILQVSSSVSPVVLSMFSDPLLCDLMEPVSVISPSLNVGDGFWQDSGQDGHEGEDGSFGHKLESFIFKLIVIY